jgi:hypothetical protein
MPEILLRIFKVSSLVILLFITSSALGKKTTQAESVKKNFQRNSTIGLKAPWQLEAERPTDTISRTVHPNFALNSVPKTAAEVVSQIQTYFGNDASLLSPLSLDDFSLSMQHFVPGKTLADMWYVTFQQKVNDIPVLSKGIHVTVKIFEGQAKIAGVFIEAYPSAHQAVNKKEIRIEELQQTVSKELSNKKLIEKEILVKFDKKTIHYTKGKYRLLYEMKAFPYRAYIDADTHKVWVSENSFHVAGKIQGRINPFGVIQENTLEVGNFSDLAIITNPRDLLIGGYTDEHGNFNLAEQSPFLGFSLGKGRWVQVTEDRQDILNRSLFTQIENQADPIEYIFNNGQFSERNTAHANAFFHTHFVHDWLRERGIGNAIDRALVSVVNLENHPCWSRYHTETQHIEYGAQGIFPDGEEVGLDFNPLCKNAAVPALIYHEYGHFVDHMLGGWPQTVLGQSLSEAWGDIISTFILGQPEVGKDIAEGVPFWRTVDIDHCYDENNQSPDIYLESAAWSGFAWHLREALIAQYGVGLGKSLAEELIIPVMNAGHENFYDSYREVLLRDDNDGDFENGTPHSKLIQEVGRRHCIANFDIASCEGEACPAPRECVGVDCIQDDEVPNPDLNSDDDPDPASDATGGCTLMRSPEN